MICPSCSSEDTQTIRMAYLSGTRTGTSSAVGIDIHGNIAAGQINSVSQTALSASLDPGAKPTSTHGVKRFFFGAFLVLGSIGGLIGGDPVGGCLLFLGAGVALIVWASKSNSAGTVEANIASVEWRKQQEYFDTGWICNKCGRKWIPFF